MKKVYLLFLLCCMSLVALSQTTTVTIFATGAAGSFKTGTSTTTVRADGNIVTTANTRRGYAVFDLSSLPAGVAVTSCTLGFNVATYAGAGTPSGWNTLGFSGDLSTVTAAGTLFTDMGSGTSLATTTYGTAAGNGTQNFTAAGNTYITGRLGSNVSICFTGGNARVYTITGETGSSATNGIHAPYLTITYCNAPTAVTAAATPTTLCEGNTLTLTGSAAGATSFSWNGPNTFTAATAIATNVVTPASSGVYTVTAINTCGTVASTATAVTAAVTVNGTPAPILGGTNVCTGRTLNLTNATTGGAWSISGTSAATISATGTVSGVSSGTAIVTYTTGAGCLDTVTITDVDGPANITGGATVICVGTNLSLNDATTGGVWSSSASAVVTVSTTGVATALSGGSATILYTLPSGCFASANLIVNPSTAPPAITGATSECQGSNTTLHDGGGGGNWSSSNTGIALIYPTGVTYGIGPGTATITFTSASTGCSTTTTMTVIATPPAITGSHSLCAGTTTTLTDATTGGTWSSTNAAVATIDPNTGIVSGLTLGTTTISYIVPPGCPITAVFTVNPLPAAITGSSVVCTGGTTTLTDATTGGGTWSSLNTTIATVGLTTGVVFGVQAGATIITFTASTGCAATVGVNDVDPPSPLTGGAVAICSGVTVALADVTTGGTWSSDNTAAATVDGAGVVTGATAGGVANISYTVVNACAVTTPITVNPLPGAIAGGPNVCTGLITTLTDAVTGGTWISSNTTVATVDPASGAVTGVLAGTSTITYTLGTGCLVTLDITDSDPPGAITGGSVAICQGTTVALTETSTGGTWSSSNTAAATVDATGIVTGAGGGVATISYSFGTGCSAEAVVTVNPLPAAITNAAVCTGNSTTFTDATSGGTWSSSNTVVATVVNITTGVVQGLAAGTSTISYTLGTGCFATSTITDSDPPPALGTTTTVICQGDVTTFTEVATDGTWSSSNALVATVDVNGNVTGAGGGIATISYIEPTGCFAIQNITVNPTPAAIAGATSVCTGSTTQLTDATTGGTWSSQFPAVADVNAASGVVTGFGGGTTNITYTVSATGCFATLAMTDNDPPGAITGTAVVCAGSTTTLASSGGGTWSSSATIIATVDAGGNVGGVSQGTSTISYILGTGCFVTTDVTVNPLPAPIGGSATVCTGSTTQLTETNTNGGWSSQFPSGIADVDNTGLVTGIGVGVTDISYTITATGCFVTLSMTVNPTPDPIAGPTVVCEQATINLTETTLGGGWVSSDNSRATIDPTGLVTGVSQGTITISYIMGTGCFVTAPLTINPIPAAIGGDTAVCTAGTTQLTETNTDGLWSSQFPGIADVDATGLVSGVSVGTTAISYIITATGCYVTTHMLDNDPPTAIIGTSPICVGATVTFTDAVAENGMWSSLFPLIATANAATGEIFGSSPGADTIYYTVVACPSVSFALTVNPAPLPIEGPTSVCVGSTITLTDGTTGGLWSTGTPGLVLVSPTGDVTGTNAGPAVIYYITGGCTPVSYNVTVNPTPTSISGVNHICATFTTTLTDGVSGGVWTSLNTSVATIDLNSGLVSGSSAGTTTITYTLPAGCFKTFDFTVNPLPAAITFPTAVVCQGSTILFSDATTGGIWTSGSNTIASVGTGSGLITGGSAGVTAIIYTLPTGCLAQALVTVNPLPLATTAPVTAVCVNSTITLTNSSPGGPGSWSSINTSLATVGLVSGIVTGVAEGTTTIIYSLPTGCNTSTVITVNPLPAAIFGLSNVCVGSSIILTDPTPGGTWSTVGLIANVGLTDGVVNGLTAGVTNISYTLTLTGCSVLTPVTVNPLPSTIGGATTACTGATALVTDADAGGSWSSTDASIATIGSASGIVYGLTTGTTNIIYTFPTGCSIGTAISVEPTPVATVTAGGPTDFCLGGSVLLSATSGVYTYQWFDNDTAITGAVGTTFNAGNTGTYEVAVTNSFGCTDTSATINVSNGIFPTIEYTGSDSLCAGNHLTMTVNTGAAVGVITYVWLNGVTPVPGAVDVTYTANSAGAYSVEVNISGASGFCTVLSDTVNVIVHPLPVPLITFDGTRLSTSGGYLAYQWFLNTVGIPGAIDSSYAPVENGSYRVLVVDSNGCDGYSPANDIAYLGIKQVNKTDVRIYPNPASSVVHIESGVAVRAVISGVEGKVLIEQAKAKDIDISGLASGVYLIMVYDEAGNQLTVEKLIKE